MESVFKAWLGRRIRVRWSRSASSCGPWGDNSRGLRETRIIGGFGHSGLVTCKLPNTARKLAPCPLVLNTRDDGQGWTA